jgi:alpha-galactosidase
MNAFRFELSSRLSGRRFGKVHPIALCCLFSLWLPAITRGEPTGPLKVFVLAGQSNMQGHAHVRTLDAMRWNPKSAPLLKSILGTDDQPHVCERVWISSIGSSEKEKIGRLTVGFGAGGRGPKIGPELMFGIRMEEQLDEPILLIKTAWGGKSLHTDFRPPGAGENEFSAEQLAAFREQGKDIESIRREKADATGRYYRLMVDHVKHVPDNIERVYPDYEADQGYELAGFADAMLTLLNE